MFSRVTECTCSRYERRLNAFMIFFSIWLDTFPDTSYHTSDTESLSCGQLRVDDQWLKADRTIETNQQTYLLLMIHSMFYVL